MSAADFDDILDRIGTPLDFDPESEDRNWGATNSNSGEARNTTSMVIRTLSLVTQEFTQEFSCFLSANLSDRSCFCRIQRCSSSRLFRRSGRAFSSLFFRIASLFISRCDSRSSPLSYPGVIALRSLFGASLGPTGMATSLRRQMAARSS